jgi:hypothetical protein
LAESVYGDLVPRSILVPMGNLAAHLIQHLNGQPVLLGGEPVDQNPAARLASAQQRIALAWRDRTCTHPGCNRPATWSLHAHHLIPYGPAGPTAMPNLVSLCPEHHVRREALFVRTGVRDPRRRPVAAGW